ncbi:TIGR04076 family protein [Candidatus Bipolaricaulota bacterium]|nr:TIGR04076 family protein [Candidatus Bipolaricaulota bacterium]
MSKYRITVVKRHSFQDLVDEYVPDHLHPSWGPCGKFTDGQVFDYKGTPPEGFCSRAFASIWGDLSVVMCKGNAGWINKPGTMITCCNDGLTPVVFKLERIEEESS